MHRRRYLAGAGTFFTTALVGCIESVSDLANDATTGEPNRTPTALPRTGTPTGAIGTDDYSIDGRLHTDTEERKQFTVTVETPDGSVLVDEQRSVGPTRSSALPAVGRPGATQTFTVTVEDTTVSETLTFDVERTPEKVDGYVDITFTRSGDVAVEFTPLEYPHDTVVTPEPRVDSSPYEIDRPEYPDDPDADHDWNEEYLGEHMPTSPSLEFSTTTPLRTIRPPQQFVSEDDDYWADLIVSERALNARLDLESLKESVRTHLLDVDFDESVVVAVETGFGSQSVDHRWARVEPTEDGVALHGYYTDPLIQFDDLTTWTSLVEVARPVGDVEIAHVSLTVGVERRVHFNSTEGLVAYDSS